MEFLLIIGIGTVVAIWAVANLPKPRGNHGASGPSFSPEPPATPPWKKDIVETHSMGDMEYLEKLERYQKDPQHWPCPLPPQREQ
jgi:hypothetical protein